MGMSVGCSGVDFHNILYDAEANAIAVRMTVYIRPWVLLMHTIPLKFNTLLELEDVVVVGAFPTSHKLCTFFSESGI